MEFGLEERFEGGYCWVTCARKAPAWASPSPRYVTSLVSTGVEDACVDVVAGELVPLRTLACWVLGCLWKRIRQREKIPLGFQDQPIPNCRKRPGECRR